MTNAESHHRATATTHDSPLHAPNSHADSAAGPFDCVNVGAGHNGLVAGAILARDGRRVLVLESSASVGGACRTEHPFESAPGLGCSTGAYLLGPMPPEVLEATGLSTRVQLLPRRPHGFFTIENGEPVAFGMPNGTAHPNHLSPHDRLALDAFDAHVCIVRDAIASLWLTPACPLEDTIGLVPDTRLANDPSGLTSRELYRLLIEGEGGSTGGVTHGGSIAGALAPFAFESEMLASVLATDGLVGSTRGLHSPGTGMNFLVHSMLRLPAGDRPGTTTPMGAWQLVKGGMGAITRALHEVILERGGEVRTHAPVLEVRVSEGRVLGVALHDGTLIDASQVILATDPFKARVMCDVPEMDPIWSRLNALASPGSSLKVNLALTALPNVPAASRMHTSVHPLAGTLHVLPKPNTMARLEWARIAAIERGELPDPSDVMIDVYTHTAVDPSLCDQQGRHAMSMFVQWVPSDLSVADAEAFAWAMIRGPLREVMPELPGLVYEVVALPPIAIEQRFGITHGHIHHLDNAIAFERRLPCRTPIEGLLLASAACHPAGSVIGCAGFIAASLARAT